MFPHFICFVQVICLDIEQVNSDIYIYIYAKIA